MQLISAKQFGKRLKFMRAFWFCTFFCPLLKPYIVDIIKSKSMCRVPCVWMLVLASRNARSPEQKFTKLADTCVKRYFNANFTNEPEPWHRIVSFLVQSRFLFQFNDKIKQHHPDLHISSMFTTAHTHTNHRYCVRASRFSCLTFLITVISDWTTPILN